MIFGIFLLLQQSVIFNPVSFSRVAFFKAAFNLFDADFYVKADDDIYLRPGKLDCFEYY